MDGSQDQIVAGIRVDQLTMRTAPGQQLVAQGTLAKLVQTFSTCIMKLDQIKSLIAVADFGSIRAAATQVGKTQSAVTKQIRQIEEDVGLKLFLRTSRGVLPTEAGKVILSRARAIDAEVARLNEEIGTLHGDDLGNVKVSAAPLAAVHLLPRAISRFNAVYKDVDITISSDLFGDALKALREGQHDIILGPRGAYASATDVKIEELFETEMVIITSKNGQHANARSLKELTGCYWAMMGDTTGAPKARFQKQFTQHGITPPRIRLASESRLGLLALVQELDAVCTFPAQLLREMGPDSGVVQIPIEETLNPLSISLITRAGKSLTPASEYFADCIRHRAGVLRKKWG